MRDSQRRQFSSSPDDFASAIYTGVLHHRRFVPFDLSFNQKLFMLYLDLSEIDTLFEDSRWWSRRGGMGVIGFRRSDYYGDPGRSLDTCIRELVLKRAGLALDGPIRLLAQVRCLGFCFNPIAIYYCFRPDGHALHAIVAEVTNTPWGERHQYVLTIDDVAQGEKSGPASATATPELLTFAFNKALHVSPFFPMDMRYSWRCNVPQSALHVQIALSRGNDRQFSAGLSLQRQSASGGNLRRALLRFPAMTWQVTLNIYWQALKLWMSGAHYVPKPSRSHQDN